MSEWKSEHRLLQWPFIKAFAGSEFVKFAAVIPVVGYIIIFNDSVVGSLSFLRIAGVDETDSDPFWLSSVTKLRLAFFGGIFMLVANSLQAWLAPRALENSKNDVDFTDRVVSTLSYGEIVAMQKEVLLKNWVWRTPMMTSLNRASRDQLIPHPDFSGFSDKRVILRHGDYLRGLSREWWSGKMHQRRGWRYTILLIASMGYAMLLAPTLDITQAVVFDLVR
ncbi:hypothetical protein [uncultured Roseobacter sp.]|uniref:hypothetical protein n=1 Tax=uncultured Roseobacter sp. TaxID=114847 RepID=UPI00261EFB49|nr:hypothetical protein [uncultured Roseobacter sp.]